MPELPEVETIKEELKKHLLGKKIFSVKVYYPGIIEYPDVKNFESKLSNQTINNLTRRGKWIIFELDDYFLLSHLRMEGHYLFRDSNSKVEKHEHVVFKLKDNDLRYKDTRKFGKMLLLNKDELYTRKPLSELGVEPFSNDLTVEYLKDKYRHKNIPIKTSLLDQKIIVGIGNIYADEILFKSHISPLRKPNNITDIELKELIENINKVLSDAIIAKGSHIKSYNYKEGSTGSFQNELLVYGKKGEPCPICNTKIEKIILNGRGTHYCPNCQK